MTSFFSTSSIIPPTKSVLLFTEFDSPGDVVSEKCTFSLWFLLLLTKFIFSYWATGPTGVVVEQTFFFYGLVWAQEINDRVEMSRRRDGTDDGGRK